jgi:hypothetical protein
MQKGASAEKVEAALGDYRKSPLFSPLEKLALENRVKQLTSGTAIASTSRPATQAPASSKPEDLARIALENFRSKFNPFLQSSPRGSARCRPCGRSLRMRPVASTNRLALGFLPV